MKFLQIFILISFFNINIYANYYNDIIKVSLKKDEQKKILVKYGRIQKLLKFRWTLYHNEGLVVFRSYDNYVAQNILYLNHSNQSFRVELFSKGANNSKIAYFLIKFASFDFENKKANFELYLSDKEKIIKVEYLEND